MMHRSALLNLDHWFKAPAGRPRKPLVLRGARQVGKSYLVREFCRLQKVNCLEINFEKEPSLRRLFVEGNNSKTISLLELHFQKKLDESSLLFLDEIQSAPEVFSRLRYFFEESQNVAVIAAGSLLEFALADIEHSVPVGRIQYLHLGPMRFEEYLQAIGENSLLEMIQTDAQIPLVFHERLLDHVRDFSVIGGMPEVVSVFKESRDFISAGQSQRAILETYQQDFSKYKKRISLELIERVFNNIPTQVGKKWVHARVNPDGTAQSTATALDALCKARVAHRVYHSAGNGVPLASEKKDKLFKVIFLDVGLMSGMLGLTTAPLNDPSGFERINEGALAEQWVGQHLLDLRLPDQTPESYYWVREKAGSQAEVDYLWATQAQVLPIEVKSGSSVRAKSLQVFLAERPKSPLAVHFSSAPKSWNPDKRVLGLPFYLVEQMGRIVSDTLRGHTAMVRT